LDPGKPFRNTAGEGNPAILHQQGNFPGGNR
jgi:hypothetical protein